MRSVLGLAIEARKKTERLARKWVRVNRNPLCRSGCSFCCHQPVGTLVLEGVIIAWKRPEVVTAAGRDDGTTVGPACPYLGEDGCCAIYSERPISCSTMFPLKACYADAPVVDAKQPVIAARHLDDQFCGRIGMPWPGPLVLPLAIQVGAALLEHGVEWAAKLITMDDQLILTKNPGLWAEVMAEALR